MRNYALLVAVLALGAYAYFGIHKKEVRENKEKALNERLVPWKAEQLSSFAWEFNETHAKVARDERGWVFVEPFEDRADLASVENWLDSLAQIPRQTEVYSAETFDLATYGLDEPAGTLVFEAQSGDLRELKIGQLKAFDEFSYVLETTTNTLFTAGSGLENLLRKNLLELRDRRVWRVKDPVASSLELVGKWKLTKDATQQWSFAQEVEGEIPVGLAEVNEYLTDLTNLRLLEVVSESSEAVDLRRYGLNRPVAELRIVTEEGGEPEVLTFSSRATQADPNNIYVTSSHFGFIGRLYASVLENVDVPRSKFFNRAFPFRQIAVEQVHEVKFQGVEELGVVTGEPARSLAEELKKMKLRSHLPSAPRAKLVQSLSLQSDENQLLFKMSWEELGEDERQNVQVRIEPSGVAGKVPAGTLKDLIRIAQPNQAEQGESPSVP